MPPKDKHFRAHVAHASPTLPPCPHLGLRHCVDRDWASAELMERLSNDTMSTFFALTINILQSVARLQARDEDGSADADGLIEQLGRCAVAARKDGDLLQSGSY